jgi:hypothetical protein
MLPFFVRSLVFSIKKINKSVEVTIPHQARLKNMFFNL